MKPGLFITFEGGEGSGKTSHIKNLALWLRSRGRKVLITLEPGGTPLAKRIRALLLDPGNRIEPLLELLFYEVARRDHVERIIRPALGRGEVVLCDRFTDATVAYQGYGRRLPLPLIAALNEGATMGLRPRLTFLFDLPVSLGLKRAYRSKGHWDRLERAPQQFHQRVRLGYLTLARKEKRRFRIIDTRQPREEVGRQVRSAVLKVL